MNTYTVEKKMQSTFDFGHVATVDLTNQYVKAHLYDSEDWDNCVISFTVCDTPCMNTVVFATGVFCRRSTCIGDEIYESFDEGNMGARILRELSNVFDDAYPNAEIRLYTDEDFGLLCKKAQDFALGATCALANTSLPKNAIIDIAKGSLPAWTEYKQDPLAISRKLRTLFIEMYGPLEETVEDVDLAEE